LHFAMKLVRAAPWSSRPFFPTALLAHVSGACAAAEATAKVATKIASMNRIIFSSLDRALGPAFERLPSAPMT
jgi:hypothetical protein